jgi:hypothetical protein
MTGSTALRQFLSTDPRDVSCGEAMALLHVYADLAVEDPGEAQRLHPGISVHLRACGPCAEDLAGLLAAIRSTVE